jgi:hypothetical protein
MMAKKTRTSPNLRARPYSQLEIADLVGHLFCQGKRVPTILDEVERHTGRKLSRSDIYNTYLKTCLDHHIIRYEPPPDAVLAKRIGYTLPKVDVRVVESREPAGVAAAGADAVIEVLRDRFAGKPNCHIGLAGGGTMKAFTRAIAQRLTEPDRHLPKTLTFHTLVASQGVDPTLDPIAFCAYLKDHPAVQVELDFKMLHAPLIVPADQYSIMQQWSDAPLAPNGANDLDIVVTSASPYRAGAPLFEYVKQLNQRLETRPDLQADLAKQFRDVKGDMLWQGIRESGFADADDKAALRVVSVVTLGQLPELIRRGKAVVLIAGPMHDRTSRSSVIKTILKLSEKNHGENPMISHLVVDHRCAEELIDES